MKYRKKKKTSKFNIKDKNFDKQGFINKNINNIIKKVLFKSFKINFNSFKI